MTPERWQRVQELFHSALARATNERAAFLRQACADDPALRAEVESLLASHDQLGDFLDEPLLEGTREASVDEEAEPMVGRRVGPYQILREIGRGGMGTVYLAERADGQFHKQVAIKLIPRGMDTDAIVRRFRHEQQILAHLDHPNIGKLLDGGTTAEGRSYFIMDYVEGRPIHEYCATHRLTTAERLELFRTVCSAVQYAHAHQVVHRDLKPDNILVTADGVPKLLDFGIAKVLHPEAAPQTADPTGALRLMTPDYASPEQVRGSAITPASDVYSLGVLLYELLTGQRPYHIAHCTPQEIERVICETEPEKPSAAIGRVAEGPGTEGAAAITATPEFVSRTRNEPPGKLCQRLAGDLDNIVLMALRKEPARRYPSVEQFSEDIRRHLEGRPVLARQDTLAYRSGKFLRRNRTSLSASLLTAVIFLVLLGVGRFWLGLRPPVRGKPIQSLAVLPLDNLSRDPEQEYFADGMTEALITDLAKIRALRVISRTSAMQYKGQRRPLPEIGRKLNVDSVIEGSVQRVGDRVRISVQLIHAATDRHLWAERYERDLRDVLALQNEVARAVTQAIQVQLTPEEQGRLARAHPIQQEAYEAYLKGRYFLNKRTAAGFQKAAEYFQRATDLQRDYARAYAELANCYVLLGNYSILPPREVMPKARTAALKALALDDTLAEAHSSLGAVRLFFDWDWSGGERELQQAIALSPGYPDAHLWYSHFLAGLSRHDEAIAEAKRAQESDPLSLIVNSVVGRMFWFARQYDQAIQQQLKTLEMDSNFARAYFDLGRAYVGKSRYEEAIEAFQKAVKNSGDVPYFKGHLGHAYAMAGKRGEALKVLDELQELSQQRYVPMVSRAFIYTGLGEKDQALMWLERAYEERNVNLVFLKVHPIFDSLRADPRFVDLMRRVGLSPSKSPTVRHSLLFRH